MQICACKIVCCEKNKKSLLPSIPCCLTSDLFGGILPYWHKAYTERLD